MSNFEIDNKPQGLNRGLTVTSFANYHKIRKENKAAISSLCQLSHISTDTLLYTPISCCNVFISEKSRYIKIHIFDNSDHLTITSDDILLLIYKAYMELHTYFFLQMLSL